MAVSVFLAALVSGIIYLLIGPQVPMLHFVLVTEGSFESDATRITPLPPGSAASNFARLQKLAQRYHASNPTRVGAPVDVLSLSEFGSRLSFPPGESLVIYVSGEAWCAPVENEPGKTLVEFLPGKAPQKSIPLAAVLGSLAERKSAKTLLLLELTGRRPGLASGSLSDDIPGQIRSEVEAAKIPGLTLICACDRGERSWEYFSKTEVQATQPAGEQNPGEPAAGTRPMPRSLPEFQGTAFGFFLAEAFENGEAGTPEELFQFLKAQVQNWVEGNTGETQTVWMVSTNKSSASAELLQRAVLPKEPDTAEPSADPSKDGPLTADSATPDSPPDAKGSEGDKLGAGGNPLAGSSAAESDDRPATRVAELAAQRNELGRSTVPAALMPADWIRLQTELLSAELLAINGSRQEFDRLYDSSLKPSLARIALRATSLAASNELQPVRDWLSVGTLVTQEESALFRQVFDELVLAEPGKGTRLPPEFKDRGRARQAFVSSLMKDLDNQSQSIAEAPVAEQTKRIQDRISLLKNLALSGWPSEEFPEQLSTMREVLHGDNFGWLATSLPLLDRLLDLRQQTLQLAAAMDSGGKALRRDAWDQSVPEIDRILMTLHAAERWLSIGPAGAELAADRLTAAAQAVKKLLQEMDQRQSLTLIRDMQRFELPYLIQYLALRQEDVALPETELNAARKMALSALNGAVDESEFPGGQLDAIGFTRAHIDAMFALTRDFAKKDVSDADTRHWQLLQSYVNDRLQTRLSASERWQLISLPTLADRATQLSALGQVHAGPAAAPSDESSRSGIWLSFWSLRLVEALAPGSDPRPLWQQWSDLINAVADARSSKIPSARAILAQSLRTRWSDAMQQLQRTDSAEVFPPAADITALVSRDVERRLAATTSDNRLLYSGVLRSLSANAAPALSPRMTTAKPDLELTAENTASASVRVGNVTDLYVLNDGITLANPDALTERNWSHLKIDATTERDVVLELQMAQAPASPKPVMIVGVNAWGAVTASASVTLHPPSATSWEIDVVQVLEGNPAGKMMALEVPNATTRRLRLLPSTFDALTKMHAPTALKFRLRQQPRVTGKVQVQLFFAADGKPFWPGSAVLEFPDGVNVVDLPLSFPVAPAVTTPPTAAAAPLAPTVLDFSRGLMIRITPVDLLTTVTSQITVIPELAEPEQFVQLPEPRYDFGTNEIEIRVDRAAGNNAAALQPAKLPVEVVFSDRLSQYLIPGAVSVPSLQASGHTFIIRCRPEIEQVLGEDGIEFGISVAGIPHAWWWKLSEGIPTRIDGDAPQVRTFLQVVNSAEVKPVADAPVLMLGESWRTALFQSTVFLHGGNFDTGAWELGVDFQRQDSNGRDPATAAPFIVRKRFVETVSVSSGENGAWLFSTTTEPYSLPLFVAPQFGLQSGRYDLVASLRQNDTGVEPVEWSTGFVLDDSGPELTPAGVQMARPRTRVSEILKGTIRVADPESGVKSVRYGLNPEMLQTLTIERGGNKVEGNFELDASQGFPKLEQKENENSQEVSLFVEAENVAGKTTAIKKTVTFYLPGKAGRMVDQLPGSIEVTFNSGTPYVVSIAGPKGKAEPKTGVRSIVFPELPVGEYTVSWKTEGLGSNSGSAEGVKVSSGKTTTVVGKK